ncbi:hypothetical protein [Streptomyces sp. NPDC051211]|uniref:hypothetical protein n=1 Tax=Streptomyces sp. NPDC051211 TaxID=3154643 RepID=UPI00344F9EA3
MLIRLWERHGPEAVQALMEEQQFPGRSSGAKHPLPAVTHKTVRQALAAADGLALLRARLTAEEDPGRLVSLLRRTAANSVAERVRHLADEGTTLPWPQLLQAHTAEPLSADLLCTLALQADCPRPLLLEALGAKPLHRNADGMEWLLPALNDGRLPAVDVLRRCRPAPRSSRSSSTHTPAAPKRRARALPGIRCIARPGDWSASSWAPTRRPGRRHSDYSRTSPAPSPNSSPPRLQ